MNARQTTDLKPRVSLANLADRSFRLGFDKKVDAPDPAAGQRLVCRITLDPELGKQAGKDFVEQMWDPTEEAPDIQFQLFGVHVPEVDWNDPYSIRKVLVLYVHVRLEDEPDKWWTPAKAIVQ